MKTKQQNQHNTSKAKTSTSCNRNKPLHKQFELLYRTRQALPSQEQYESVFFMKHHKISAQPSKDKQKHKKQKKNAKQNKKNEEQKINNRPAEKTKQKFPKQFKFDNTKSTIPFLSQADYAHKQLFSQSFRDTISMDKTQLKKIGNLSNSNSSRYLDSKFINKNSKPIKQKSKINQEQIKVLSSKTAKDSSRIPSKISSPKNLSKPRRKKNLEHIEKCDSQYIFFEGQFIKATGLIFNQLEKQVQTRKSDQYLQRNQFLDDFSIMRDNTLCNIMPKQLQQSRKSSIVELTTIQSFLSFKVIIIQRWWRKILERKANKKFQNTKLKLKNSDKFKQLNNVNNANQQHQFLQTNSLQSYLLVHEEAILNYMNAQKNILNKLKQSKQICDQEYIQKLSQIEASFQGQMLGTQKIKRIMQKQIVKIKQLQQKIDLQSKISTNINSFKAEELLKSFFKQSNKQNIVQNDLQQFENKTKSNGCHFANNQDRTPIAFLPEGEREVFEKDSSDENDEIYKDQQQCEPINLSTNLVGTFQNMMETYQDQQNAQMEIQKRYAIQVGLVPQETIEGPVINTSVMAIHGFLTNFIKFYQYFYKDQFLKLVNMPFGHNQLNRLKILQRPEQVEYLQQEQDGIIYGLTSILNVESLEDYHQHTYNNLDLSNQNILQMVTYQKIHNQAILDCFNQSLNHFRPYYFVNGPPYMWNYSEKALTFYFIAQQNIKQVFEKTQYRVLKTASSLCGMIVDKLIEPTEISQAQTLQNQMVYYNSTVNQLLMESRQQKLSKMEKMQIQQNAHQWLNTEQEKTSVLFDTSNIILIQLLLEACCEVQFINQ